MRYKVTNPLLCTKAEADEILSKLHDQVQEYGCVLVKDVYDMVFMLDEYRGEQDSDYGWINMNGAIVNWNDWHGAYEICLPAAIPLRTHTATADNGFKIRQPKLVAEIIVCGAMHLCIDDTMSFTRPTAEQIKNLRDMLCIDVIIHEEELDGQKDVH